MKIRLPIALFSLLLLAGCNNGPDKSENKDTAVDSSAKTDSPVRKNAEPAAETPDASMFEKYISSLRQIPLPFKHSAVKKLPVISGNYYAEGFKKYKSAMAEKPLGILFKNDKYIITLDYTAADLGDAPCIMSYDAKGNKIDSLIPYRQTGYDMGYEAVENLNIKKDKEIIVSTNIKTWDKNRKGTDTLSGSMKQKISKAVYKINGDGKIIKK